VSVRRFRVEVGGRSYEVALEQDDGPPRLTVDGAEVEASLEPADQDGTRRFTLNGRQHLAGTAPRGERIAVALDGLTLDVTVEDERRSRLAQFGGGGVRHSGRQVVRAPMPGLVVRVNVTVGQQVAAGESVVVLQAMKMENELGSPRDGTIASVAVEAGQAVEQGQPLVELE
jgi:biotin carboxyl carrier protein